VDARIKSGHHDIDGQALLLSGRVRCSPMKILLTNDDGVHAPGLEVAERIARKLSSDVWVIAPEMEQSGASHKLTFSDPIRLREIDERRFAVKGTPTDCVIMGLKVVIGEKPDLILSGVNRGQNLADDITYSGTVAGAMEGTILGVPSIALSQAYGSDTVDAPHWETGEAHAPAVIAKLMETGFGEGTLFNVNFPNCPPDAVKGVVVTRQGRRVPDWLRIETRRDARGFPYHWIGFRRSKMDPEAGTDLAAIQDDCVSITPLSIDLTDERTRQRLAATFR
jgi:5'-nucleotidase